MDGKVAPEQGLEHPELPDGTAEFLDSWLVLLERLVSPKHILETPHTLPKLSTDGTFFRPFDPHKFMAGIHKVSRDLVVLLLVFMALLISVGFLVFNLGDLGRERNLCF